MAEKVFKEYHPGPTIELADSTPLEFEKIDPEEIRKTIEKIDNALRDKDADKKVKQKLNDARKNWLKNRFQ